ncbi:hypothetical protein F3Y22_tig00117034pilonHSYRG00674 [Hibiscus syriacus]|uniref:Uncharacterized protein n=1 Tax=Hibiscus syriacus TaxID=106335 RepID=A0A6A2WAH2_HIBSY|nr:hypothetical protein F3Y22_tig00117034pilonHSYRG00674 [Hibiscus syriacus]
MRVNHACNQHYSVAIRKQTRESGENFGDAASQKRLSNSIWLQRISKGGSYNTRRPLGESRDCFMGDPRCIRRNMELNICNDLHWVVEIHEQGNHPNHDNVRWDTWARFVERSVAYRSWIWTTENREIDIAP